MFQSNRDIRWGIAQLTASTISSFPDLSLKPKTSQTAGQSHVTGAS
jgi:hypothetical protein